MTSTTAALCLLLLSAPASCAIAGEEIAIRRASSQPSIKGARENFTGDVRVDSRFQATAPARVGGGIVAFAPGARTAWHTHPLGQTLIVTAGAGRVQHWGGPIQDIGPGDVVWIPPGVKHWHGALNKKLDTDCLICGETFAAAPASCAATAKGTVQVRGREHPVDVYALS